MYIFVAYVLTYLLHLGQGYLLKDPVNTVHCCGQITMWHYEPVNRGTVTFSVWRKTYVNRYKVVGTNAIVVQGNDVTIYPGSLHLLWNNPI